jgi:hypothetical protein
MLNPLTFSESQKSPVLARAIFSPFIFSLVFAHFFHGIVQCLNGLLDQADFRNMHSQKGSLDALKCLSKSVNPSRRSLETDRNTDRQTESGYPYGGREANSQF